MSFRIKKINDFKVDIEKFKAATAEFLQIHPFHREKNQVCLTHRLQSTDPYYEGAGSLYDFGRERFNFQEEEFDTFHEAWRGSYLYDVYVQLREVAPYQIGRIRLMNLRPVSCLSLHVDPTVRLHIPIETNENCLFVFRDQVPIHMPADGSVYVVDTRFQHTVINGDKKMSRIHFVAALVGSK